MAQNRKPPAYQEYAATMLASRDFRLMSLPERGLFYTIRLECWENKQVPSIPLELAKYIGFDIYMIEDALTPRVKSFLGEKDGLFTCPELEGYRKYLEDRSQKQSRGGKSGAAITNAQKKKIAKEAATNSRLTRQGDDDSLVKSSSIEPSKAVSSIVTNVDDVELLKHMSDYEAASNGG